MASVTQRVKQVKQPRGGYVNPRVMEVQYLSGGAPALLDHRAENIHASLVGMAVDYLTRAACGTRAETVFNISLYGAKKVGDLALHQALVDCATIESGGLDTPSIEAACRLVGYDVIFRAGMAQYNPAANLAPDAFTVLNIRAMVERALRFFDEYGPVEIDGFLPLGRATEFVDSGDGDFLTFDTLWDFKVSVNPPTIAHTLQLLMYWLIGRDGNWCWQVGNPPVQPDLQRLLEYGLYDPRIHGGPIPTRLGIYNPRLDAVYLLSVTDIPADVITAVSRDVIGYHE